MTKGEVTTYWLSEYSAIEFHIEPTGGPKVSYIVKYTLMEKLLRIGIT